MHRPDVVIINYNTTDKITFYITQYSVRQCNNMLLELTNYI